MLIYISRLCHFVPFLSTSTPNTSFKDKSISGHCILHSKQQASSISQQSKQHQPAMVCLYELFANQDCMTNETHKQQQQQQQHNFTFIRRHPA